MTVPDEAVEAAAGKVLETLDRGFTAYQIAYAALDAAAPFIRAQALTDAANRWPAPWPIEGHDWLNQQARKESAK